ncbi:hypothetical protein IWX76_002755 [Pedobacter sp. CAN_A7]|uniref:hypothetical protein n=1 Tax=Pedobacter sp. CAN_A7 TaxID=2787722 RepID=UPI0018CA2F30
MFNQFLLPLLSFLENSAWALAIRQSLWLYPALEIIHILGIVMLVGGAIFFDLRLLGLAKNLPLPSLSAYLLPLSRRGLLLVIPSGILLFLTNAETLGVDPTFWLKMLLLVIAALNALVFHRFQLLPVKLTALVSIFAWIAIIACGRLLAY